jgi:RNA polymerase sigma-70 factor, ECF subfamily
METSSFSPNQVQERLRISRPRRDDKGVEAEEEPCERALVSRAREGDREAFGELYRNNVDGIARTVRLRLGRLDEDAVAEVFARAWRGIGNYRDIGMPFVGWLHGIARHVIVDELRARTRVKPLADVPDHGAEPMIGDLVALRDAIDRLPDDQRQVIELKYLAGLSNAEVAAATGWTPGAVNTRQWRALRALERMLADRT